MTRLMKPRSLYLAALGLAAILTVDLWRRFRHDEEEGELAVVEFMEDSPELAVEVDITIGDDLTQIKGIGPTYASRLNDVGLTTFEDVANASPAFLHEVTRATGSRANADEWIRQASELAG